MPRNLRGSEFAKGLREENYARSLERSADHVCIPWTGVDTRGRSLCPGFHYTEERGLVAYVIPLAIYVAEGLRPGILGLKATESTKSAKSTQTADEKALEDERLSDRSNSFSKYLEMLKKYLRVVKITVDKETVDKYMPKNTEYLVVVTGSYQHALTGRLMAAPDLYREGRFLVADGIDIERALELALGVGSAHVIDPTTVGSNNPLPPKEQPLKSTAFLDRAIRKYQLTDPLERVGLGIPAPGERRMGPTTMESLRVVKPGTKGLSTVTEAHRFLQMMMNQDPQSRRGA